jgi:hypothetical protein
MIREGFIPLWSELPTNSLIDVDVSCVMALP